ncbi:MAG: heavy metal-binding domain-containing protein [Bacteroidota bacterium]
MKKSFLTLMYTAAFAITAFFVVSCDNSQNDEATDEVQTEVTDNVVSDQPNVENAKSHEGHDHDAVAEVAYQCPMKCEGDKTYKEEGKCPECEMPLEKLENNQ